MLDSMLLGANQIRAWFCLSMVQAPAGQSFSDWLLCVSKYIEIEVCADQVSLTVLLDWWAITILSVLTSFTIDMWHFEKFLMIFSQILICCPPRLDSTELLSAPYAALPETATRFFSFDLIKFSYTVLAKLPHFTGTFHLQSVKKAYNYC